MPDAVHVANNLDSLRAQCELRKIKWHPRHKKETLARLVQDFDNGNTPPPKPASASTPSPPPSTKDAEVVMKPPREIPADVLTALDYLSHTSVGRVKTVTRYIKTLL